MLKGTAHSVDLRSLAPQEPAHQIHIVNGGIQEDPAGGPAVPDGPLHHGFRVDPGGFHQIGRTDSPRSDFFLGIGVGLVIAPHKAQHTHQFRVPGHGRLRLKALFHRNAQRLFGKHVLSRVQRRLDLPAVLPGGGHDGHRVQFRISDHLPEIAVHLFKSQFLTGIRLTVRAGHAGRRQDRAGDLVGKVGSMDPAQPPQTGNANTQFLHKQSPSIQLDRFKIKLRRRFRGGVIQLNSASGERFTVQPSYGPWPPSYYGRRRW